MIYVNLRNCWLQKIRWLGQKQQYKILLNLFTIHITRNNIVSLFARETLVWISEKPTCEMAVIPYRPHGSQTLRAVTCDTWIIICLWITVWSCMMSYSNNSVHSFTIVLYREHGKKQKLPIHWSLLLRNRC